MEIQFDDFDFTVTECIIAHKFDYPVGYSHTAYKGGRKVSGIVYCTGGEAKYTLRNKQSFVLKEGSMLYLPKSLAYTVENLGSLPFSHFTVNFDLTLNSPVTPAEKYFLSNVGEYIVNDAFGAREMLNDLVFLWANKKHGYRVMAKSILHKLLYKYFTNLEKKYRSRDYDKIRIAKSMLDTDFKEDIQISELAAACGFSETHFRRLFKNVLGVSVTDYRINKRILLAKDLLSSSELSVGEVARAVGFDDANYFSRLFKKKVGISPHDYLDINNT